MKFTPKTTFRMKIAVMQPYFAPYLGYFQLINEVDTFIFYDDVNYIKSGWVNRNYLNINGENKLFTIPLKGSSSFRKINEIEVDWDSREMTKLIKTFDQNIKKDSKSKKIIDTIIESKPKKISDMCIQSIELFSKELGIKTIFERSSLIDFDRQNDKVMNLINICEKMGAKNYINPEGGQKLYNKKEFIENGVILNFIKGYPSVSIINMIDDIEINKKLNQYKII
jgi:hypothetical protein